MFEDDHPSISVFEVGDTIKEKITSYDRKGEIVDKEWNNEKGQWAYLIHIKGFKPMNVTAHSLSTGSPETRKAYRERMKKIQGSSGEDALEESAFSANRFKKLAGILKEGVVKEDYQDSDSKLSDAADDLISMAANLARRIDYKPEFGHPDPNIEAKKAALEIIDEAERQLRDEISDMERSW